MVHDKESIRAHESAQDGKIMA